MQLVREHNNGDWRELPSTLEAWVEKTRWPTKQETGAAELTENN